jgi:2'-5' RNA ligase
MAETAFIIRVPEAEARVAALRERFDASAKLGVPAHITVLYPFMSPERITDAVLRRVQAVFDPLPSFAFALSEVARFPTTAYLVPEPGAPFVALTQALARQFPDYPPFRGEHDSIIPHLTVAHGDALEAEIAARELIAALHTHGSIRSTCHSVTLIENSSGRWQEAHAFALPSPRRHSRASGRRSSKA